MVKQYKYYLETMVQNDTFERDESGNYIPTTKQWQRVGVCRDETSSAGSFVTTTDGIQVSFSWLVYVPLSVPDIEIGTIVRVSDEQGKERAIGKVKQYRRGMLNCKIWL